MSGTELPPRPRQLVVAAGVVIGGSAFLVAAVFDALANLQSVDGRERLQDAISSSAGRDLGVTLAQAVSAVRAALGLTAVCAAIAVVLGIFVLQRHRGARIALSVVAVPLLVTAPLVGGFLGALVAVATVMLWNGAAGDWYAGRPVRQAAGSARRQRDEPPPAPSYTPPPAPVAPPVNPPVPSDSPDAPSTRETSSAPGATEGFGAPVVTAPPVAPPYMDAPQLPSHDGSVRTPVPVRVACLLTWAFSGIVAVIYVAALIALVVDSQAIVDRVVTSPAWRDTGLKDDVLVPMLWFGVLLFLVWSVGAMVLAWFTWRRHDWARYLLAASALVTLLLGVVAFPVGVLHQLACAATIGGLFAPTARAWFAGRGRASGQQPPPRQPPW